MGMSDEGRENIASRSPTEETIKRLDEHRARRRASLIRAD